MAKKIRKNEDLQSLIRELKKTSLDNKVKIWKRIAEDLEKPTRNKRVVNVYKLSQYSKKDDVIVVPGKVLGSGDIDHSIQVAALSFSSQAIDKINEKGKVITLRELIKTNPKGKNIKIIG